MTNQKPPLAFLLRKKLAGRAAGMLLLFALFVSPAAGQTYLEQTKSAVVRDSATLTITTGWAGAPFVPTSGTWSLLFTLKTNLSDADSAAKIQKASGTGVTPVSGQAAVTVDLIPDDSTALTTGYAYFWDVQAQNTSTGAVRTIARGKLIFSGDVTRETTSSIPIYTTEPPVPGNAVTSVFTRTGAVVAAGGDYTAAQVTNVPAGTVAATDVQAAITELDTEKTTLAQAAAAAPVQSVNGATGAVVLDAADVGADISGAAASAQSAAIAAAAADATSKADAAQAAAEAASDPAGSAAAGQAYAIQRANHTGTQLLATISDAGDAAGKNTGTTAGTVAAGDDSRITGAAQKASNLSDLADAAAARDNLGLTAILNTSRANVALAMISGAVTTYSSFAGWAAFKVGTGNLPNFAQARGQTLGTGATAGGTSGMVEPIQSFIGTGRSLGVSRNIINWSKAVSLGVRCTLTSSTPNGLGWMYLGGFDISGVSPAAVAPASRAIGFKLIANALWGLVHNGTSITLVDLSSTLSTNTKSLIATADGAGNVSFYVNDVLAGSTTAGPTGNSAAQSCGVLLAVDNGADNAAERIEIHFVGIYAE